MIRSQRWKGAAFTVPFQLGFVFLYLLPIGYAVYQSLYKVQQSGLGLGGSTEKFTGLDNYREGFTDSAFMGSVLRVVVFACVQIPVMLLVSLVLALLLDAVTSRAASRFRILLLVPYMIPGVVAAIVWINLYSPDVGPLTAIGDVFGFHWNFFAPSMVWPSIGNLLTWHGIGYNMVIIYSALQAVPRELFEAARLDGASELRIARSIKVPYVRGALVLTGLLSIIQMLQIFNEPALFRNVTPQTVDDSFTPIMIIYNQAFNAGNYHYAAALSVLLALILGLASFVFYRLTSREAD
ncbi:carbohydrate ABC transporter permease [Streptomyces acidiscabies]|uniref:Sugar ABC transporter permease n=1 Tax=Streptomyces acidiscabies TaxID=42234 RepID=A0AAP6EET6_9ACTN|nr:sugar ABC transporter permease [Streptomyces acidiscabies]MBP5936128.1 sugar ABC transporter permease [Streptomyces sp. LBUM 1476]MBZ3915939.1 sugar ABC transporter permease [Streptomyces acidiscabies]MDX2960332.1 sugar ABC transporter permease [Streptomyces acidiscabies]MDX3023756.1 sugar ABC transporter permease [Streptomyces acidiscabies]MDX3793997.1 sugar ABC transporter permease [Streptomyces acidiscabies]